MYLIVQIHSIPYIPVSLNLDFFFFDSLHGHSGQVLMSEQPLPPCSCSWVPSSIAMATVFLQVLTQGHQRRAQTSTIWSQDTPRQLEQDGGHTGHAVIRGLQGDGPDFKGGVRKAHQLREERVGAAKVLVATVSGRVVMV